MSGDKVGSAVTAAPVADDDSKSSGVREKNRDSDSENSEEVRQRILEQQQAERNEPRLTTNLSSLWTRTKKSYNPDDIATQPSVFDDPELAKYFRAYSLPQARGPLQVAILGAVDNTTPSPRKELSNLIELFKHSLSLRVFFLRFL